MKEFLQILKRFSPFFKDFKVQFFFAIIGMILAALGTAGLSYILEPTMDGVFVEKGENSATAALRAVKEKLGIELDADSGKCAMSMISGGVIADIWLFVCENSYLKKVKVPEDCEKAEFGTKLDIIILDNKDEFVPFTYLRKFLVISDRLFYL